MRRKAGITERLKTSQRQGGCYWICVKLFESGLVGLEDLHSFIM